MIKSLGGLVALSVVMLAAGWHANTPPSPKPVIIQSSDGGTVSTFLDFYNAIKWSGVPVQVDGMCISACTLVLGLPKSQLCVMPGSKFGFHLASSQHGMMVKPEVEYTDYLIRRYYPDPVRAWLKDKKLTVEKIEFMDYDEIVNLGVLNPCK